MKNYAKFCKLDINNKSCQLNLTEGGLDGSNIFNKLFSVLRFTAPVCLLFFVTKGLVLEYLLNQSIFLVAYPLTISLMFTLGTMLPHTLFGNIYNSILKNYVYKQKIISFYNEMRELEVLKQKKGKYTDNKQEKKAKKILKYFEKQTKKFEKLSKKYYKKKAKKQYLDGIKGFALECLETRQETVDKFIFHNAKLLIELVPEKKGFILDRFNKRLKILKSDEPFYDEFVWTSETGENLIKNDCINKTDTSNYIQSLQELLGIENKSKEIKVETLKSKPKTIDKTNKPSFESIYNSKNLNEIFNK